MTNFCFYARDCNNSICYFSDMIIPGQIFINYYAKEVCISNLFNTFVIYGYFKNDILFFIGGSENNKFCFSDI